jgi:hypothetical protein
MNIADTNCTFVVKETAEGEPYVIAEPDTPVGAVGLRLKEGSSIDQAREVAAYLRRHVSAVITPNKVKGADRSRRPMNA